MNAERLVELANLLLAKNRKLELQPKLENLRTHLDQLTGNPGDSAAQTAVSGSLNTLADALATLQEQLTPAQAQAMRDIGAWPFFSEDLAGGFRALLLANAVTPASVRDRVAQVTGERAEFLVRLEESVRGLRALGVEAEELPDGSAEVGFLIPRVLFNNSLRGLTAEFAQLDRIIAVFSEIATGEVGEVEVHQISTTDPLIFLGTNVATITLLAAAVKWVLDSLKTGMEIRKLHSEAAALKLPDAIIEQMKQHVTDTIDAAIAAHAKELVKTCKADDARTNELENAARFALKQLLAKVERGMTVEVRLIPPPISDTSDKPTKAEVQQREMFERLDELSHQLVFPSVVGDPLIPLEPPTN